MDLLQFCVTETGCGVPGSGYHTGEKAKDKKRVMQPNMRGFLWRK